MSDQLKLGIEDTRRHKHALTIVKRSLPCVSCGRELRVGTEAVILSVGLYHLACVSEFGAMGGR
jgi:hypothetical protein